MGYSEAVSLTSTKKRDQMMEFLDEYYRGMNEFTGIYPEDAFDQTAQPMIGEQLAYDEGVTKIGFNYSSLPETDRHWMYCFLNWIAIMEGRKKKFEGFPERVPYRRYDGFESTPIITKDTLKKAGIKKQNLSIKTATVCDSLGYFRTRKINVLMENEEFNSGPMKKRMRELEIEQLYGGDMLKYEKMLKQELERLNKHWNEY